MEPPTIDAQLLTLLNSLLSGQKGHVKISRDTNDIAHSLRALLVLTGQDATPGPCNPGPGGLVQQLVDQLASLEEAQARNTAQILEAIKAQTRVLTHIARELGLRPLSHLDAA